MNKIFKFLSLSFVCLIFSACGNSTGDLMGLGEMLPDYNNSKVLTKLSVQKEGTAPYDINYQYTQGKLTSVTTSDNSFNYQVNYLENKISKIKRSFTQGSETEVKTSNIVYVGTQITKIYGDISNGNNASAFVTDISYSGGKVSQVKTQTFLAGSTVSKATITSNIEYAGINVSKITYTVENPSAPAVVSVATFADYDAKQNPFRTLPTAFLLEQINWNQDMYNAVSLSANNFTVLTGANSTENFTYTYDSSNYPSQVNAPGKILKFEYLKL